jgi:uncharacterized membrane protein YkvA (DUF1232 family)
MLRLRNPARSIAEAAARREHRSPDVARTRAKAHMAAMNAPDLELPHTAGAPRSGRPGRGLGTRLLRLVGRLPFAREVVAGWHCALDRRTPLGPRLILFATFAYVLSPVDLIPDFVALIGITDDLALLWVALRGLRAHITDEHRARARRTFRLA